MVTIKVCTSIEQSRKLANILPPDSADMYWWEAEGKEYVYVGKCSDNNSIPAWSLTALLNILPKVEGFKPIIDLDINQIRYEGLIREILVADNDELVDAVVEIIIKLHEQNLL